MQFFSNSTFSYFFCYIICCTYFAFHFYFIILLLPFFCMSVDVTDNAAFVVHAQLGPEEAGSLTYYVPVIVMDAEEDGE